MLKNIKYVKIVTLIVWVCLLVGFSNYAKYPSIFYPEYQIRTLNWNWFDLNNERNDDGNNPSVLSKTDELYESGDREPFKLNEYEQKIWNKYLQICPKSLCHKITKLKVNLLKGYAYPETTPTTTEIELISPVLDRWILRTDIAAIRNLEYILTHEIGHIIALNNTQVDQTTGQEFLQALEKESNCQTYYSVYEGCSFKKSHINIFYQKFWKELEIEQQKAKELAETGKGTDSFLKEFYQKTKDYFVSDLARNNPNEDFAETFANFVLKEKPIDNKVNSQKIIWMYQQPELVQIRNEMLESLKK
jgi:hypothetical protein